ALSSLGLDCLHVERSNLSPVGLFETDRDQLLQLRKFDLAQLDLVLQQPQGIVNDLTGALVQPTVDHLLDERFQLRRQVNVHGLSPSCSRIPPAAYRHAPSLSTPSRLRQRFPAQPIFPPPMRQRSGTAPAAPAG